MAYTEKQKEAIIKAKKKYNAAYKKGDETGMEAAHKEADEVRGFSTVTTIEDGKYRQRSTKKVWSGYNSNYAPSADFRNLENKISEKTKQDKVDTANKLANYRNIDTNNPEKGVALKLNNKAVETSQNAITPAIGSRTSDNIENDFYSRRKGFATPASKVIEPTIKTPININNIKSDKMDNTVKNTLLAKAAKEPAQTPLETIGNGIKRAGEAAAAGLVGGGAGGFTSAANKSLQMIDKYSSIANALGNVNPLLNAATKVQGVASRASDAVAGDSNAKDFVLGNDKGNLTKNLSKAEDYLEAKSGELREKSTAGLSEDSKGRWLLGGVEGVAAMAPTIGLAMFTGGGSVAGEATLGAAAKLGAKGLATKAVNEAAKTLPSLLPFMVQAGGNYARDAENRGYSLEQQVAYGIAGGFAEGATELIGFGPLKAALGLPEETLKAVVKSGTMNAVKYGGKKALQWLNEGLANVMQEVIVNPMTASADKAILDHDKKWVGDNGVFSMSDAVSSGKGALAMSTVLVALGLPKNTVSYITARKYVDNQKVPTESDAKSLIKTIEKDLGENLDVVSMAKDSSLFTGIGLEEDYTPEGAQNLNKIILDKYESTAKTMEEIKNDGIELALGNDEIMSTLKHNNNLLKNAVNNDIIVESAKPYYEKLSKEIDALLEIKKAQVQTAPTDMAEAQIESLGEPATPILGEQGTNTQQLEKEATTEPTRIDAGKRQGSNVTIHKTMDNDIYVVAQAKAVTGDIDYDIVKVNEKNGDVTFVKTDDFDGKTEPTVVSETTVSKDGVVNTTMPESKIIIDKASYVPEDYAGFDVEAAKAREHEWRDTKKHGVYNPRDIEQAGYFNERAKSVFKEPDTTPTAKEDTTDDEEVTADENDETLDSGVVNKDSKGRNVGDVVNTSTYGKVTVTDNANSATITIKLESGKEIEIGRNAFESVVANVGAKANTVSEPQAKEKPAKEQSIADEKPEPKKVVETSQNKVDNGAEKAGGDENALERRVEPSRESGRETQDESVAGDFGRRAREIEEDISRRSSRTPKTEAGKQIVVESRGDKNVDERNGKSDGSGSRGYEEESTTEDAGGRVRGIEDEIRSRPRRTEKTEAEQKITEDVQNHYPETNAIFFNGNEDDPHGFSSYSNPGDIFINSSSKNKSSIYFHEIYHRLLKGSELGDVFKNITDQIYDSGLCDYEIDAYVKRLKESDPDLYPFFAKNRIMALEEILASEFANNMLGIENFDNSTKFKEELSSQARSFFKIAFDTFIEENYSPEVEGGVTNDNDKNGLQGNSDGVPERTEPEVLQETGSEGRTGGLHQQNDGLGSEDTRRDTNGSDDEGNGQTGLSEGIHGKGEDQVSSGTGSDGSGQRDARRAVEGYRITEDSEIDKGGKVQRYDQNVAAIVMLKTLKEEQRTATAEEMDVLARFSGWGGIKEAFVDNKDAAWKQRASDIKFILTKKQYSDASMSVENAFYTPISVINSMYEIARNIGVKDNSAILEPGCGVGYFLGCMPGGLRRNAKITGVEIDSITGNIAKQLYPNADIKVQGFEDTNIPKNSLDLVIGNVPFGTFKLYDKEYKDYSKYLIHDYFSLKGLDSLKPGGIMAVITTSGTMDKQDSEARKLMAEKANLVAAIRMPSGTFNATGVVADLLIFQKKGEGVEDFGNDFIETKAMDFSGNGNEIGINEYFVKHPEMVLGNIEETTDPFGKPTITVKSNGRTLNDVIGNIPKNIIPKAVEKVTQQIENEVAPVVDIDTDFTDDDVFVINKEGKIYKRNENSAELEPWYKVYGKGSQKAGQKEYFTSDGKPAQRLKAMLDLFKDFKNVMDVQIRTEDKSELKKAQDRLSKSYDEFVKKFKAISESANKSVMQNDPKYWHLCSLETKEYDGDEITYVKSSTFTERVVPAARPITSVDNALDALAVSLNINGKVNLGYMQELYGKDKDTIVGELNTEIYEIPDDTGNYVTAEEYLSGNVKQKLKDAKEKVKSESRFDKNVRALEEIQPIDLRADEIAVELGTPWVGTKVMSDFVSALYEGNAKVEVGYDRYKSTWAIQIDASRSVQQAADARWGASGYRTGDLIDSIANKKNISVYEKDSKGNAYINEEATKMAQGKGEEIKEFFNDWIYKDAERRETLVDYYNEHFNNLVGRKFDGSKLKMYGVNPKKTLRSHQLSAIARVLFGGQNVLFAHPVGAGKTFAMIGAVQEMKRLGISQKPLMVVPNNKINDFMHDYYDLYPNAKILTIRGDDFTPANRKRLLTKIQNTNFDCVIMRHSSFQMFPFSPEYQEKYIQNQIDELEEAIRNSSDGMDKRALTSMNNKKKSLGEKLKKMQDTPKDNAAVYLDTCGVDSLTVDEAHNFKNLDFPTKMGRVAGVQSSGSEKATNMHMATTLMNERGNKILFATATPISNSIGELFTMMRYLEPKTLSEYGIDSFDAWADTFGRIVSTVEMNTTGSGLKTKDRFSKFSNVPELIKIFKIVADIIDKKDLDIALPEADFQHITAESSEILDKYNDYLEAHKRNMSTKEAKAGGHLLIMQDARHASLDLRCVRNLMMRADVTSYRTSLEALDLPDSKINKAIKTIYKEYADSTGMKGTQIVFLDRGTPQAKSKKEQDRIRALRAIDPDELTDEQLEEIEASDNVSRYGFDLYADIKTKLIRMGVPENEIDFMQDNKTDEKKTKLFDKVNAGQVRILIGSTAMMGEGMNAQRRAVAVHQIDAPMRPSDVEQRIGRVVRQGNLNKNVRVYNYSTLNSYDAPTWEMLARKNSFINDVMLGDESKREISDIGEDWFADLSVAAANNPLMFDRKDVTDSLGKLDVKKKNFQRTRSMNQNAIRNYPDRKATLERFVSNYKGVLADIAETPKEKAFIVDGKEYENMKEASKALQEHMKGIDAATGNSGVGSVRGISIIAQKYFSGEYRLYLKQGNDDYYNYTDAVVDKGDFRYDGANPETAFLRLSNKLDKTADVIKGLEEELVNEAARFEAAKKSVNDEFPNEKELVELKKKLIDIDAQLRAKEKSPANQGQDAEIPKDSEEVQYSKGNKPMPSTQKFAGQIYKGRGQVTGKTEEIIANVPKGYKTKIPRTILLSFMTNFKTSIHSKNFRRPKDVLAIYKPAHGVINTRYAETLGPVMHEAGHVLDKNYGFSKERAITQMLKAPGYSDEMTGRGYKDEQKPAEVIADFTMLYLTNPNAAYELGGHAEGENFYDTFEEALSKEDLKNIRDLQRDILMWGAQDSVDKAMGTVVYRSDGESKPFKQRVDNFMTDWIDKFYGAKQVMFSIKKTIGNDVKETSNVYSMLQKSLAVPSTVSEILTENLVNSDGFAVGKSLGSILNLIKPKFIRRFDLYLKDVHALDWMAQNKRVYSIEMDSEEEIRARNAAIELEHPEFKEAAEELYAWWRNFTNIWLVDTGIKTQEFMDSIHEQYPHYVPNFRQMDSVVKGKGGKTGGDPIKRASEKGSDRPTYSAIESLLMQVASIVQSGIQNRAMQTLDKMYNDKEYQEAVGLFFDKIPPDLQINNFDATGLKAALNNSIFNDAYGKLTQQEKDDFNNSPAEEQIVKASEMSNSQLIDDVISNKITYFTAKSTTNDTDVVVCLVDGKPKFYNILDENLANAFMSLEPMQIEGVVKMVKSLTRAFTGATTAKNPLFAAANHARDIQHGVVLTESKYNALNPATYLSYFKDLLVSYGQVISHTKIANKLGVKQSQNYALYRPNVGMSSKYMPGGDALGKASRQINGVVAHHKKTKVGNVLATTGNIFTWALDVFDELNGVIEASPRMIAFNRTLKKYGKTPEGILKATQAARESTVAMQIRGRKTEKFAIAIPFVGAAIAGIDQFRRITMTKEAWTTKEGRQILMRAVITQAIPAIIMAMLLDGDDDYEKLQSYIKDGYWLFKHEDGAFTKIPKEREISAIFGTSFQRIVANYLNPDLDNKEEVASYLKYVLQTFTPAHDVTGWAIFDAMNNKTWYGGTIVSQRDEALMQPGYYDDIYDDTTSKLAIFLAKVLPDVESWGALNTPRGIEYVIDQLTGGIGDVLLPATTETNAGMSNELLRRYMTDSVYSNKYSGEAYDILDELNAAVMSGKRSDNTDENTEAWQKAFSNTLSGQSDKYVTVSDYYAQIRDNNNNQSLATEEREKLNREARININRITEELVKAYKSGGDPGYSFADVAISDGATSLGITEAQYKAVVNATTAQSATVQKFALATQKDLTDEQKAYLSETLLNNKSYDEWGKVYSEVSKTMTAEEVQEVSNTVKDVEDAGGDAYTHVLKSGEHKGETRTDSITAGSDYDTGAEGHKSLSRKKKEAIDAAYPDLDKPTKVLLYQLFDVSEKLY